MRVGTRLGTADDPIICQATVLVSRCNQAVPQPDRWLRPTHFQKRQGDLSELGAHSAAHSERRRGQHTIANHHRWLDTRVGAIRNGRSIPANKQATAAPLRPPLSDHPPCSPLHPAPAVPSTTWVGKHAERECPAARRRAEGAVARLHHHWHHPGPCLSRPAANLTRKLPPQDRWGDAHAGPTARPPPRSGP